MENVIVLNNTNANLRHFGIHDEIVAAVKERRKLNEAISDIFTVKVWMKQTGILAVVDWA